MPPRKYGPSPGAVSSLCICGKRRMLSQAACGDCWRTLPPGLQKAWLAAKDGECAREGAAIRDYLRKEQAR
jgi:hypothetical protein